MAQWPGRCPWSNRHGDGMEDGGQIATGMTDYERRIVAEIAGHVVRPGPLQSLLDALGAPFEAALKRLQSGRGRLARRTSEAIDRALRSGVHRAVLLGARSAGEGRVVAAYRRAGLPLASTEAVAEHGLEARDRVAERLRRGGAVALGGEGLVLGAATTAAEVLPFAQLAVPTLVAADVAASTTLLGRHLVLLAGVYGYPLSGDPGNLAHVLAAMVPQQYSWDEGFVPAKIAVAGAAREAGGFVARLSRQTAAVGFDQAMRALGRDAPQLIRLINLVVERLGLRVTQKSLGMLVPLAGGAVNAALNVAFHQAGHTTGVDYFRLQVLSQRHGEAAVRAAVDREIVRLRGGA